MKIIKDFPLHNLPDFHFFASDTSTAFGDHRDNHRISFYAIVWFSETCGTHYIDFEPFPVQENSVHLIANNQLHSIPAATLPESRVIVFSADFFDRIADHSLRQLFLPFDNSGIGIPEDMIRPMKDLFALLLLEFRTEGDPDLLLQYTVLFLGYLARFRQGGMAVKNSEDKRIVALLRLLENNFREQHRIDFYAHQLGITGKRINELLRQKMGTTLSQLIYRLLLVEAKRSLFNQQMSVKEIAYHLGFTSQSYFARFFRKYTGLTPEEFRAAHHKG